METRIVVLDNDMSMRILLSACLTREGWEVCGWSYNQVNLTALTQCPPDLVILDINLPEGGPGWEFLHLLKRQSATAQVPILVMTTAFELSPEVRNDLAAQKIAVMRKPFERKTLVTTIQETLTLVRQAKMEQMRPILPVDDSKEFDAIPTNVRRSEDHPVLTSRRGQVAAAADRWRTIFP